MSYSPIVGQFWRRFKLHLHGLIGFSLRLSMRYWPESLEFGLLLASAPVIGIIIFHYFGLYRLVTRFIGPQGAMRILSAIVVSVLVWSMVVTL